MKFVVNNTEYSVKWHYDTEYTDKVDPEDAWSDLSPTGKIATGRTWCHITTENPVFNGVLGIADCSDKDKFSRPVGRKITFDRAVKQLFPDDRSARAAAWEEFFKMSPKKSKKKK